MKRVAIVGPGGAGKTTFARALGAATDLPVLHLDEHQWQPGWVGTERDVWRRRQAGLLTGEHWIVDGNYSGTFDARFARADTVIIVARHRVLCVASALWRSTKNHGKAIQAEGCPERYDRAFYRWIWNYDRTARPRLEQAIERHPQLTVIELTTRREMRDFLAARRTPTP